jgi:hypothetical protein
MKVRVKMVTKMDWPSFMNVAVPMRKALNNYYNCVIYYQTNIKPEGNSLFIGTVFPQTPNFLGKFFGQSPDRFLWNNRKP